MADEHAPTGEQQEAIDLFKTGGSLAIEAGAGTGKTSTLVMLAKAAGGQQGQYVAFNKALVEESRVKFPMNVVCNTAHSLAFRAVGRNYKPRLDSSQRIQSRDIAARLGVGYMQVETFDGHPKTLYPGFIASQAMKTVQLFCQSADPEITARHAPYLKGLNTFSQFAVREALVPLARTIWQDLQSPYGWAPFRHEHYLKMWQLQGPVINTDFILFDEAQDANPVIAAIIAAQDHAQLVYVGDSQQEIYAWTGAVNALADIQAEHRTFLTQSFRFGQAIADRANQVLELIGPEAQLRLTGNPAIDSRLERLDVPKAVLTRTNAVGVGLLLAFQLKERQAHLIGGAGEMLSFARGAQELMDTGHSSHPDLIIFDSWAAVQEYVKQDEGGEDLRLMVRLMDNFGSDKIMHALEHMPNENRADIVISTAHKSKGREWYSVQLANDFPQNADSAPADLRLLYVAVTRAKVVLDASAVDERHDESSLPSLEGLVN